MKRLQENRINLISSYLKTSKLDPALFPEILDHLSCEAEEGLWDGKSFEQAFKGIVDAATPETLLYLSAETKQLLSMDKSLNDIVFEGRNKLYGAYALRKGYKHTMQRAVLLGVTIFLLMVMLPDLYARLVPERQAKDIAYELEMKNITIKPELVAKPQAKVLLPKSDQHETKSFITTLFKVLPGEILEVEYTPPTNPDLSKKEASRSSDPVVLKQLLEM
jgi:protein TonB